MTIPKAIHYTCGGPWFEAYKNCEFADIWLKELEELKTEKPEIKSIEHKEMIKGKMLVKA